MQVSFFQGLVFGFGGGYEGEGVVVSLPDIPL